MKRTATLITILMLAVSVGFAQKKETKQQAKKSETVEFRLGEEICANCKRKIDNNIAFERGVTGITYGKDGSTVQVTYRSDRTDTLKLRKAFDKVKLNVAELKMVNNDEKDKKKK